MERSKQYRIIEKSKHVFFLKHEFDSYLSKEFKSQDERDFAIQQYRTQRTYPYSKFTEIIVNAHDCFYEVHPLYIMEISTLVEAILDVALPLTSKREPSILQDNAYSLFDTIKLLNYDKFIVLFRNIANDVRYKAKYVDSYLIEDSDRYDIILMRELFSQAALIILGYKESKSLEILKNACSSSEVLYEYSQEKNILLRYFKKKSLDVFFEGMTPRFLLTENERLYYQELLGVTR